MIVFDLTTPGTFKSVHQWVVGIQQSVGESPYKLLVGNKDDLIDKRAVKFEEA